MTHESIKNLIREIYELKAKNSALKKEKEAYRDFIGERGLTDEYKEWVKVNTRGD